MKAERLKQIIKEEVSQALTQPTAVKEWGGTDQADAFEDWVGNLGDFITKLRTMGKISTTQEEVAIDNLERQVYEKELMQLHDEDASMKDVVALLFKPSVKEAEEGTNPPDIAKMDIPLFMRLLEYAKEEALTDIDLHDVATNVTRLARGGQTLNMEHYPSIIPQHKQKKGEEQPKPKATPVPQAPTKPKALPPTPTKGIPPRK